MVPRDMQQPAGRPQPLTVAQLTARIKQTLETSFPNVWVVGEISDLARPHSGHVYLTLKDEQSQIRAVMWRATASRLAFDLADGQEVVCRGDLDVYLPRGSYQLVIRPDGAAGGRRAAAAVARPAAEAGRRRAVRSAAQAALAAAFPRRVAVVTSPTGAAIRDFLEVVRQRWQGVRHADRTDARARRGGAAGDRSGQ